MNILLTNDDGYKSPGIWALANRLKEKHNIYIVAPDGERSGASHSASFFAALSYVYHGNVDGVEVYSLSGTPADCVVFSVRYLLKDVKFDCVLSGINDVLNVGSDIMFSGTFGAAQEATYQGIKGVAISLRSNHTGDFAYAAEFTEKNLELFLKYADKEVTVNVNIPCAKKEDLKGVETCLHDWLSRDEIQLLLNLPAKITIIRHFLLLLQQKLREWAASQQKASYFAFDLHHPCGQI